MCGITGLLHKTDQPVDSSIIQKMNRALTHRGPDDEGYFVDGPTALGHRRLSIIDLSGGHQPMETPDGRYVIVFNGEIYNYQELRVELEKEGVTFQTHSDTEALLHLYVRFGADSLQRLNGMFAFAIWDRAEKKLFAARDRMGKKPFFYWETARHLAFSSECKSFQSHPDFSSRINPQSVRYFFQYEYVPAPYSIYEGVRKLPAGCMMTYDSRKGVEVNRYWDVPFSDSKPDISEQEAQAKVLELLDLAVERRLVSDVPLGVFLSGGIDSSSIVALMARHRAGKDIKTFSIGFNEKSYDETSYANLVAKKFGTEHHQQILSVDAMIEILPEVAGFLDEPFADHSIFPTYLLSKFTRQSVTVALGGDGGDELFAGYPTFYADHLAGIYGKLPRWIRSLIEAGVSHLPVSLKDMSFDFKAKQFVYGASYPPLLRDQVWLGAFHQDEQEALFRERDAFDPLDRVRETMAHCGSKHGGDQLLYFYQKLYLCDDILVKADRASMATSLEVRAPYLDVDFVEYVASLPYEYKLKGKVTKYILKKALEPVLPHEILYRPKKGFGIPMAIWLRNELKDKMRKTLDHEKIKREGLFNPDFINRLVQGHLSGKENNRKPLFALLMFEWWRERYGA